MRIKSMISIFLFGSFAAFFCACTAAPKQQEMAAVPQTQDQELPKNAIKVGGDMDAHNCLVGAGYSWSKTLARCVRIWEVGTRLYPISDPNARNYDLVIMKGEDDPIEVYMASMSSGSPLTMNKTANIWRDSGNNYSVSKGPDGVIALHDKTNTIISQSRPFDKAK